MPRDWIPRRRGAKKSSSHWKALNITCGKGMWFEREDLHGILDHEGIAGESGQKFRKALDEFDTYVVVNEALIPNYGERWRNEEAIATGFVESAVNQIVSKRFSKKQQMQWTKKGAHLVLQMRTQVLDERLE